MAESAVELAATKSERAGALTAVGRSYYESAVFMAASTEWGVGPVEHAPEAEEVFRRAIDESPETANEAHYFLARVLQDKRNYDAAKEYLEEYLDREPSGEFAAPARAHLAWMNRGDVEAAPAASGQGMSPPVKVYTPRPLYTEAALRARVRGVVRVQATIDEYGRVAAVRLIQGLPHGLDKAVLYAIKKWIFKPATLNGVPVTVYYTPSINFELD